MAHRTLVMTACFAAALASTGARAQDPPVTTGQLVITSDPSGVAIFVDGSALGPSPVIARELLPGAHLVVAALPSGERIERVVEVAAGQSLQVALARPAPAPGPAPPAPPPAEEAAPSPAASPPHDARGPLPSPMEGNLGVAPRPDWDGGRSSSPGFLIGGLVSMAIGVGFLAWGLGTSPDEAPGQFIAGLAVGVTGVSIGLGFSIVGLSMLDVPGSADRSGQILGQLGPANGLVLRAGGVL